MSPRSQSAPAQIVRMLLGTLLLAAALGAAAGAEPRRQIALTFDDAPIGDGPLLTGAQRTERLIAALDAAGVKGAMFFVLTRSLAGVPGGEARLRAYAAAGHALANHSYDHPNLSEIHAEAFLADVDAASAILAPLPSVAPFFRYPYLDEGLTPEDRDAVKAGLAARGLRNGYVTIDTADWYMDELLVAAAQKGQAPSLESLRRTYVDVVMGSVERTDAAARGVLGRSPRHVLLLHENDLAAFFVEDLARALRGAGWEIVPAVEAYADPIAAREPHAALAAQNRIAALVVESGASPRALAHEAEDEARIRDLFQRESVPIAEIVPAAPAAQVAAAPGP